jgi:cytidylate kinase
MDSDIETTTEIENEEQISNEEETMNEEKTSTNSITNSTTKSNSNTNIVQKYIKDNSQLIILISGFSGCGKTLFAKSIAKDFDIKFINLNDFLLLETYTKTVQVGDKNIIDWEDPEAMNWEELNSKINSIKSKGVVISGFMFPTDVLKFKPNFHIHIKISKDNLIKLRQTYLELKEDSKLNEIDEEMQRRILNKISFEHNLKGLERSKPTKFIQMELDGQLVYDEIFSYLIESIEKDIYRK